MRKGKKNRWQIFASNTMKPIIYEDEKQAIQIEKEFTRIAKKNVDKQDLEEEGNEDDVTLRPVHKVSII